MFRLFLILLFTTAPAFAELNAGFNALRNGDYTTAYSEFHEPALNGDPEAQFQICGLYFTGLGVPKNAYEAKKWCELAANQGHKEAAYNLGLMFFKGEGTGQNYVQAEYWFKSAAAKGHKAAEYNLLQIYQANRTAEVRIAKQDLLERNALKQKLAQKQLAQQAAAPRPILAPAVPQIPAPTATGLTPSLPPIPTTQVASKPLAPLKQKTLTPAQQEQLVKEQNCLEAVQKGILPDNCFAEEQTPQQEIDTAILLQDVQWLTAEAEKGNVLAMNNLGVMYRRGNNVTKNSAKAFALFEQAANKGSANGMMNLASMYKQGDGVAKDLEQSYAWYNLTADRAAIPAQQQAARASVKELSAVLSNEQIGNALEYANELDKIVPVLQ